MSAPISQPNHQPVPQPAPGVPAPNVDGPQRPSSGNASNSSMRNVLLIAKREIVTHVRTKSFQWGLAITLLLILGYILLSPLLSSFSGGPFGGNAEPSKVAVTEQVEDVHTERLTEAGMEIVSVKSAQEGIDLMRADEVGSVVAKPTELGGVTVYDLNREPVEAATDVPAVVLGIDAPSNAVMSALTVSPEGYSLENEEEAGPPIWLGYTLAIMFGVAFLFGVVGYGMQIAQTVVEEKSSRIVEILLATVTPRAILAGKILGNGLLAIGQIALIALLAIGAFALTGQMEAVSMFGPGMLWFLVFFIPGFLLFASMYSAIGAMVSRESELGSVSSPLMILAMTPYMLAIFFNDNEAVMRVLSYVPISSPITMPMRMAMGTAEWWEPIVSLVILIVTFIAVIALAARMYENSILRIGSRVTFRESLKSA